MVACFAGYVIQAAINNVAPLLFVTLQRDLGFSLGQTTLLVSVNFLVQLLVDGLSVGFVDEIGYRTSAVFAHALASAGFVGLAVLPSLLDPFLGVLFATVLYAMGGGLIEVLVSPIVEACPGGEKQAAMSLLHSFYCWGVVAAVLASTAFFILFGTEAWRALVSLWALLPLANAVAFTRVPIASLVGEGEQAQGVIALVRSRTFWVVVGLMLCAGASEMAIAQWASTFVEAGLGVSKVVGDLAGPMLFAAAMGLSRAVYSRIASHVSISRALGLGGLSCAVGFLVIALAPVPVLTFVGFALCGLAVGVMWPGTLSLASAQMPRAGTALFALLALAGDVGCMVGPALVGSVAEASGGVLAAGIFAAVVFPVWLLVLVVAIAGRAN